MGQISRVLVTGGSGKAGTAVMADLTRHGFDPLDLDPAAPARPRAPARIGDATDLGTVMEAMSGVDAVVHLAAIPGPRIRTDAETFRINTVSTYNVFTAAARLGVERVVYASSETLIGIPFADRSPLYAPMDEAHPRWPETHYALSKLVGEVIAAEFARWHELALIGLRISNIMTEADYERFPSFWEDPTTRAWNLWGYVDARDVAQAARLALTADVGGSDEFLIAAADTCMDRPSEELMAEVYPNVPLSHRIEGQETLLSIDKARRVLGYQPQQSWRDHVPS